MSKKREIGNYVVIIAWGLLLLGAFAFVYREARYHCKRQAIGSMEHMAVFAEGDYMTTSDYMIVRRTTEEVRGMWTCCPERDEAIKMGERYQAMMAERLHKKEQR